MLKVSQKSFLGYSNTTVISSVLFVLYEYGMNKYEQGRKFTEKYSPPQSVINLSQLVDQSLFVDNIIMSYPSKFI